MPILQPFATACEAYASTIRALQAEFSRDCEELIASYQAVVREIESKLYRTAREAFEKYCGTGPVCENEEDYFRALREAETEARGTAAEAYRWLQGQKAILAEQYERKNEEAFRTYLGQVQLAWGTINVAGLDRTEFSSVNCLLPQFVFHPTQAC